MLRFHYTWPNAVNSTDIKAHPRPCWLFINKIQIIKRSYLQFSWPFYNYYFWNFIKKVNHLHDTFLALPWYCINIGPFLWNGSSKSNFSLISDTFSVRGCWGQLMSFFWKLVRLAKYSNSQEYIGPLLPCSVWPERKKKPFWI